MDLKEGVAGFGRIEADAAAAEIGKAAQEGRHGDRLRTSELYFSDIGLLLATYGPLAKREMLAGTLAGTVKGGVFENLVAGVLERNGHPVRYYRNDDAEVEFLIENDDGEAFHGGRGRGQG